MSDYDSSDDSGWDPSVIQKYLTPPKGSPEIKEGLIFENLETFWEKKSPKTEKRKFNDSESENLLQTYSYKPKKKNSKRNQIVPPNQFSPVVAHSNVKMPQYIPVVYNSPQKQQYFDNDGEFSFGLPSDDEFNDESNKKQKKDDDYDFGGIRETPKAKNRNKKAKETKEAEMEEVSKPKARRSCKRNKEETKEEPSKAKTRKSSKTEKIEPATEEKDEEPKERTKSASKEKKEDSPKTRTRKSTKESKEKEEAPKKKSRKSSVEKIPRKSGPDKAKQRSPQEKKSTPKKITAVPKVKEEKPKTQKKSKSKKKYDFSLLYESDSDDALIIIPDREVDTSEGASIAQRRTPRIRVKPLKHWAGERIKYSVGEDNLMSFSGIVKSQPSSQKSAESSQSPKKDEEPRSKAELTSMPFPQHELNIEEGGEMFFQEEKFVRHIVHLNGSGKLIVSRHQYNLEDYIDFKIPQGQTATIYASRNMPLRLLEIDYK